MSNTSKKDKFIAHFMTPSIADLNSDQQSIREKALHALQRLKFPTLRDERWKYTRVASILNGQYEAKRVELNHLPPQAKVEGFEASTTLVFVNGYFNEKLSDLSKESGVEVKPMANARLEDFDQFQQYYGQYVDGENYVFMDNDTYEQLMVHKSIVSNNKRYLIAGMNVDIIFDNEEILDIRMPAHVILEVIKTEPGFKGIAPV